MGHEVVHISKDEWIPFVGIILLGTIYLDDFLAPPVTSSTFHTDAFFDDVLERVSFGASTSTSLPRSSDIAVCVFLTRRPERVSTDDSTALSSTSSLIAISSESAAEFGLILSCALAASATSGLATATSELATSRIAHFFFKKRWMTTMITYTYNTQNEHSVDR